MPVTAAYLTHSIEDGLAQLARTVPHPPDYFRGISPLMPGLPRNVLVFPREQAFGGGFGARHHRFVFVTCLESSAAIIVDGRFHFLEPGGSMLVFPFQGHNFAQFRRKRVTWLFVTFEYDSGECFEALRDSPTGLNTGDRDRLAGVVGSFLAAARGESDAPDELSLGLAALLSRLARRGPEFPSARPQELSPHYEVVRGAVRYVHEHIEKKFLIADVAESVALSESRLRAVFREMVGVPLGEFVLRSRINRACALLGRSEMSVSEVARACGFESLYSFSRAFKRRRGVSPSAYRRAGGRPPEKG
ncbi:MAG: AraC family transcriptional regulator [Planctomycetota bacterium]|jgi:AraC-like DNA-binding protein